MATPLLQTKLYVPPPRPELVPRPRLIERLNAGLRRKLTLISTPAGFGKTTLVSEWVAHLRLKEAQRTAGPRRAPLQVAWLSLDESDNDAVRFLSYLIAALQAAVQTMEADFGKGALSALQSPQLPPIEVILGVLVNQIAALPDRMVLVLDDYHLIEAQPLHDALTFLLRHLPPQVHLVIATRADPPLPLARLRARGQLTELRATDLRFTPSEAAEFLNQTMGLDLSAEDIAALGTRTEGWIAGLQLAAISMQGRKDVTGFIQSFTGSHHFVLDYLVEEVLKQQPEGVQAFLLQTAVLDRLTGPLCDAVLFGDAKQPSRFGVAKSDSQATLEMLEHANLFVVPLDDERRWYRYHHLFSDLLRQRLRQGQPEQIPGLHSRASEWYQQNGFIDEAIEHAFRAEDFLQAANLVDRAAEAVWLRGQDTKLRRWLDKLPNELLFSKPHICILSAWHLFTSGQLDAAERTLQAAEQAATEQALESSATRVDTEPQGRASLTGSDRIKLQGRVTAIRAFIASYRGDVPRIIRHAHQALESLPKQDLTWRSITAMVLGDAHRFDGDMTAAYQAQYEALKACEAAGDLYFVIAAKLKLASTLRAQGRLQRTAEICQQQLQLANELGLSQTRTGGWLLAIWGDVLAELDDLDRALALVKKGVELIERTGDLAMLHSSHLRLIRVLFSRGDLAGVQKIIQKMEQIAREHDIPPWVTSGMAAWQARTWLAQDELETASQWARERALNVDGELVFSNEIEYIVLARIRLRQGRLDETTRLLQRLLERAETGGHTARAIEILLLQALALQAQGNADRAIAAQRRALSVLERALSLAEPGGFVRIFVDEGPPMARLLYEAATRGIAGHGPVAQYVRRLLAAFPIAEPGQTAPSKTQAPTQELVEPLSERELEVLELIAEGLTNPEIASRLFLALNTVKAHAHNIYGKLDVHNRTQAVSRARALGILASV